VPRGLTSVGLVVVVALLLAFLMGPILWILIASVEPENAVTSAPPQLTPFITLYNYAYLLSNPDWIGSIWVSLQVAGLTMLLSLFFGALAAYPLARLRVPGRNLILAVLIFTQMIPAIVLAIPMLFMVRAVQLQDTVLALVIVDVALWLPLIIWLLRNAFDDVPRALEAAARMDGCTRLGTLFRVVIPASSPAIAAAAILLLIGTWNEFLFAVTIGDKAAVTVTRRIGYTYTIGGALASPPYTLLAAAGFVAVLPCLLVVAFFHRRVVSGLTEGFIKG
jgi:multiple sugar transport system permease protein